jgi:hypothetical protein
MKKIAPDKWKHFWVGMVMGIVLQALGLRFLPGIVLATSIAFGLVVVVSYGFELYSKFSGHGHHEIMDALAAIVGGILGMAMALIFQWQVAQ